MTKYFRLQRFGLQKRLRSPAEVDLVMTRVYSWLRLIMCFTLLECCVDQSAFRSRTVRIINRILLCVHVCWFLQGFSSSHVLCVICVFYLFEWLFLCSNASHFIPIIRINTLCVCVSVCLALATPKPLQQFSGVCVLCFMNI